VLIFGRDEAQAKLFHDGTHRMRSPAETVETFRAHMPRCGITRLANVTGLDVIGVPVYVAIRPNARSVSVSQGKGISVDAAKASALLECIELWHAENVKLTPTYASIRELRGRASVVDLTHTLRLSDDDLDEDLVLPWVEGWDLVAQRPTWVPLDLVSMDLVKRQGVTPIFHQNSNGLASGNHVLEAISHAMCELVERDAVTLNVHDESDPTGASWLIDLDAVTDPQVRRLLGRMEAAGVHVAAQDLTSDVGIPTYAAVIFDRPGTPRAMGWFWGFGTHLNPEVALSRALTEAAQCRLTELSGARDDLTAEQFDEGRDDDELEAMASVLHESRPSRRLDDRRALATATFEGDVEVLLAAVRSVGVTSVVVVDLSHPDLNVPVVKVVIPGLEPHFNNAGYRPGPRAERVRSETASADDEEETA
jgi:YcaO-like protein with predicted kinase domain